MTENPSRVANVEALAASIGFDPVLHFRFGFGGSFAVDVDGTERAPLYLASGATAWLKFEDRAPIEMSDGDVVLLPRGGRHRVYNDIRAVAIHLDDVFARQMEQRGRAFALDITGTDSIWSGSCFLARDFASHPLISSLPEVMHLRANGSNSAWLEPTVLLMRWMSDLRQGASAGMADMSNVLIRNMVTDWLRQQGRADPVVLDARLRDARILTALQAIHTRPEEAWTLDSLARACHMSRTAFAIRFHEETGQSPARYLARWRVHLAARLLREQKLTLDQAAERVGYSSGAILARAHKRLVGFSPSADDAGRSV